MIKTCININILYKSFAFVGGIRPGKSFKIGIMFVYFHDKSITRHSNKYLTQQI